MYLSPYKTAYADNMLEVWKLRKALTRVEGQFKSDQNLDPGARLVQEFANRNLEEILGAGSKKLKQALNRFQEILQIPKFVSMVDPKLDSLARFRDDMCQLGQFLHRSINQDHKYEDCLQNDSYCGETKKGILQTCTTRRVVAQEIFKLYKSLLNSFHSQDEWRVIDLKIPKDRSKLFLDILSKFVELDKNSFKSSFALITYAIKHPDLSPPGLQGLLSPSLPAYKTIVRYLKILKQRQAFLNKDSQAMAAELLKEQRPYCDNLVRHLARCLGVKQNTVRRKIITRDSVIKNADSLIRAVIKEARRGKVNLDDATELALLINGLKACLLNPDLTHGIANMSRVRQLEAEKSFQANDDSDFGRRGYVALDEVMFRIDKNNMIRIKNNANGFLEVPYKNNDEFSSATKSITDDLEFCELFKHLNSKKLSTVAKTINYIYTSYGKKELSYSEVGEEDFYIALSPARSWGWSRQKSKAAKKVITQLYQAAFLRNGISFYDAAKLILLIRAVNPDLVFRAIGDLR